MRQAHYSSKMFFFFPKLFFFLEMNLNAKKEKEKEKIPESFY